MSEKTFLLCVGAQKAGTTWLYDYLAAHPACYTGGIKEYHVFDVASNPGVFGPGQVQQLMRAIKLLAEKLARPMKHNEPVERQLRAVLTRILMRLDHDTYVDHFLRAMRKDPTRTLAADMTPSYCGLSVDTFAMIRDLFANTGLTLKVLFLMRDPLDRLGSVARHIDRRHAEKGRSGEVAGIDRLAAEYNDPATEMRARYDTTITTLEQVFAPEALLFEFYEELFTQPTLERICGFLGIEARAADFETRVHASPETDPIPDDLAARIRAHYDPTYRFCMDRFGEDRIRALWPSA